MIILKTHSLNRQLFFETPLPTLLLGSPMLMDPHPSQQHAGLQHAVLQPQQEVTRRQARFKPNLSVL